MNPKEIGAFLKQPRNEKGITPEQLGEILGVSGRSISFCIMFLICAITNFRIFRRENLTN